MNLLDRNLKRFFRADSVSTARDRLDEAKRERNKVTKRAEADGKLTIAEKARLEDAGLVVRVARVHLNVRSTQKDLQAATRRAEQGGVSSAERARLEELEKNIRSLKHDRSDLKSQQPGLFPNPKATDLRIGSFNITGSSHTRPGGEHPEFESGPKRMHYAAKAIARHKLDIVGFQELQADQLNEFRKITDNRFGVYPGFKLGAGESVNSIAWDKSKWDLVKPATIGIPYFNGNKRQMPVVLLQNKETGQRAFFMNFHNPADTKTFHAQEKFRDAATRIQVALVNRLRKQTGLPVFLTGDMNERQEYQRYMTAGTELESAHKGKDSHWKRPGIDWIFGSQDVAFSDFRRDRSPLVAKTTNHPLITSKARIRAGAKH